MIILLIVLSTITLQVCDGNVSTLFQRDSMASVPLGKPLGDGELDLQGVCHRSGTICENCTHAVTCIQIPNGFLKVPLESCNENKTCNAKLGGCSPTPVPECQKETQEFEHICEQIGIFPDAYDCRKFHMCAPSVEYPRHDMPAVHHTAFCPRNYAYDPFTAQCRISLENGQCEKKLVEGCKTIGQNEAIIGSPSHYYVCLSKDGKMFPQIFICPHGQHYVNGFCSDPNQSKIGVSRQPKAYEGTTLSTLKTIEVTTSNPLAYPSGQERIIFPWFQESEAVISDIPQDRALLERFGVSVQPMSGYYDDADYI